MSLFETLKKAIFHNPLAKQTAPHASPATAKPANTTRVTPAGAPAAGATTTSSPGSSSASSSASAPTSVPSRPAGTAAPAPAAAAQPTVDVEQVLEALNAKSSQSLNWRSSIVDLMKLVGLDSSLQNRKSLAAELGYSGDTNDSAAMNVWLHKAVMKKLAENGGKVPASLQ